MFLVKDIIGKPVITVSDGRNIGKVKDVYLAADRRSVAGIYLGSEGLFSRKSSLIKSQDVITIGKDAVIVKHENVVQEAQGMPELEGIWLRRDDLQGRPISTPGGTKVGVVDDIILDDQAYVVGFTLDQVLVSGPLAERGAFGYTAVTDMGDSNNLMTIDLAHAEGQNLAVTSRTFQADEVTTAPATENEAASEETTTPYAKKDSDPVPHLLEEEGMKSPYVTTEGASVMPMRDETPHTSTKPDTDGLEHNIEEEGYKSPYVTDEQ